MAQILHNCTFFFHAFAVTAIRRNGTNSIDIEHF